jgi:hypothetical protein
VSCDTQNGPGLPPGRSKLAGIRGPYTQVTLAFLTSMIPYTVPMLLHSIHDSQEFVKSAFLNLGLATRRQGSPLQPVGRIMQTWWS